MKVAILQTEQYNSGLKEYTIGNEEVWLVPDSLNFSEVLWEYEKVKKEEPSTKLYEFLEAKECILANFDEYLKP